MAGNAGVEVVELGDKVGGEATELRRHDVEQYAKRLAQHENEHGREYAFYVDARKLLVALMGLTEVRENRATCLL